MPAVPAARSLSDERKTNLCLLNGLPCGSDGKESAHNARDPGLIPGLRISLDKGMTTHSSVLAYGTPWTKEPGRLQSLGLERVRYD